MERIEWPKLTHERPADIRRHAARIKKDFSAIQRWLEATPNIPRVIKEAIVKGLGQSESLEYVSEAALKRLSGGAALMITHVMFQCVFKILQDSFEELYDKLLAQTPLAETKPNLEDLWRVPSDTPALTETPPDSSDEDTESMVSSDSGSDTEDLEQAEWIVDFNKIECRINKLKARLQEVEGERQAVDRKLAGKTDKIKDEMRLAERELRVKEQRHKDKKTKMKEKRQEQDATRVRGTGGVGYNLHEAADFRFSKQNGTASAMVLGIQKQSIVNRLFNMSANALMRTAIKAVTNKAGGERFSTITHFLGAELLDCGDICLWANRTNEYDWRTAEGDVWDGLEKFSEWDQDIVASFGTHLTTTTQSYGIEMKALEPGAMNLQCRKRKADAITKLVKANAARIPGLHIDHIRDISPRSTGKTTQALNVGFTDPKIANDALSYGLFWQGVHHYCEYYDKYFFYRCCYCQIYGHPPSQCGEPRRCGSCSGPHQEDLCTSTLIRCALCNGNHKVNFKDCPAKKARRAEKVTFRFPTNAPNQLHSPAVKTEPKTPSPITSPTQEPAEAQKEERFIDLEDYYVPEAEPTQIVPPGTPTLLAQQLHEKLPAVEAALQADVSAMQRRKVLAPLKNKTLSRPNRPAKPLEELDEFMWD